MKIRQPMLMMKYLACLILMTCVRARPQRSVREVTMGAGREQGNGYYGGRQGAGEWIGYNIR